jgi:hypothetical protein
MVNRLVKKFVARRKQRGIKALSHKIQAYKNLHRLENIFRIPKKIKRRLPFKSRVEPEV